MSHDLKATAPSDGHEISVHPAPAVEIDTPSEKERDYSDAGRGVRFDEVSEVERKKPWWNSVREPGSATQIVICALIAIAIGMAVNVTVDSVPEVAVVILGIPGRMWLRALTTVVLPLIITAMILAVQRLKDMTRGGSVLARWTIGYYVTTTVPGGVGATLGEISENVLLNASTQGITLNAGDYVIILLFATLGSLATTPIPSSSLVLVVMIAGSVNVEMTGMYAVIVAIDWFLDRFRTMLNVSSDLYAATIITKLAKFEESPEDALTEEAVIADAIDSYNRGELRA